MWAGGLNSIRKGLMKLAGPYAVAALTYLEAGFSPLPALGKLLKVKEVSGRHPEATKEQIEKWSKTHGLFDVALRLPTNVLGLDIDEYKGDRDKLEFLENHLGKLPETWNSDSRGGHGGKLLYRVQPGIKWKSNISGITIIQHTHRYVIVFPSHNKESDSRYLWYIGLDGQAVSENKIPSVEDLTELPKEWIEELKKSDTIQVWSDMSGINNDDLDLFNGGDPCRYMEILTEMCKERLINSYESGLHDTGLSTIGLLITTAANGHTGIVEAIDVMSEIFCSAPRSRDLVSEWNNLLSFVLAQVDADNISEIDSCGLNLIMGSRVYSDDQSIMDDVALLLSANLTSGQISRILYKRR